MKEAYLPKVATDNQKQPFEQVILHAYLPEIGLTPKHACMADWCKRRETGTDEAGQAERSPLGAPELRTEEGHSGCGAEGQDLQASISALSPQLCLYYEQDTDKRPVKVFQLRVTIEPEMQSTDKGAQNERDDPDIVELEPTVRDGSGVVQQGVVRRRCEEAY